MAYELRSIGRPKVRYDDDNDDNPLVTQLVVDGEKVTPDSATITIYRVPGTALVTDAAMTVDGTLLTYSVDTTTEGDFPIDTGYRADVEVTYSGTVYPVTLVFDVVRFVLNLGLGFDQITDLDDGVVGSGWNGDAKLPGIIQAARDELQFKLETKAIDDQQLVENMIIDPSRIAIPARAYILWKFFRAKGDEDKRDEYKSDFRSLWKEFLDGVRYDQNQDGFEEKGQGRQTTVLKM